MRHSDVQFCTGESVSVRKRGTERREKRTTAMWLLLLQVLHRFSLL